MKKGKTAALIAAAAVILAVIVAGNVLLCRYSYVLNRFFSGDSTDYSGAAEELEEGDALAAEAAEGSMVLLKNDGMLPLGDTRVNLFGWACTDQGFLLVGGGSGGTVIASENKVTLTQALMDEGFSYNEDLYDAYSAVSSVDADANGTSPNSVAALANPDAGFYTEERMREAYAFSHTAVVTISRFSGENASSGELVSVTGNGTTYADGTFLELTENERAMFDALERYGFDAVVLLNTCNDIEAGFLEDYACVRAALYVGVPGQSGARAIPRILKGDVNPSGRLADTYAYDYQTNNPSYLNARYVSDSIAYAEGIYVGYRWYETADAENFFDGLSDGHGEGYDAVVQYPFGYGLSYTEFSWTVDSASWRNGESMGRDGEYSVTVSVKNVGDVPGRDVVELYYTPPYTDGGIEKAHVNLVAFAKTGEIAPGESEKVTLSFTAYDMCSYDCYDANGNGFSGYELEEGDYEMRLMRDAHDAGPVDGAWGNILYSDGLEFPRDPVTGETVENRFTGDGAYAGCPVDGSTAVPGGVDYLSRADGFGNFPVSSAGTPTRSVTNAAASYRYTGYDGAEGGLAYGEDAGMYLVTAEDADGVPAKATLAQLEGREDAFLALNDSLMGTLSDYDAPAWEGFLSQMTVSETKDLIGKGGFQTAAVESVGKPLCTDRDGPAGFNMGVTNTGTETRWTAYPVEALLGCSWDTGLLFRIGAAQGRAASATGLQGWYAPGVNLHRSVYNTRNFEYYSEDSVITGTLAAECVRGAKENGLYCYVKHLAVSEAGANPNDKNTWLTEQALRETYLKPFEYAVKRGGANGMMSAFNRVGAVWAGACGALLTEILRGEWGFEGTVITDWQDSSYMDYTRGVLAGNDLWLAGSTQSAAVLDLSDPAVETRARLAAKDILYTYVDTATAVSVTAAPRSALLAGLWAALDVVLAAGLAVCAAFAVREARKGRASADAGE